MATDTPVVQIEENEKPLVEEETREEVAEEESKEDLQSEDTKDDENEEDLTEQRKDVTKLQNAIKIELNMLDMLAEKFAKKLEEESGKQKEKEDNLQKAIDNWDPACLEDAAKQMKRLDEENKKSEDLIKACKDHAKNSTEYKELASKLESLENESKEIAPKIKEAQDAAKAREKMSASGLEQQMDAAKKAKKNLDAIKKKFDAAVSESPADSSEQLASEVSEWEAKVAKISSLFEKADEALQHANLIANKMSEQTNEVRAEFTECERLYEETQAQSVRAVKDRNALRKLADNLSNRAEAEGNTRASNIHAMQSHISEWNNVLESRFETELATAVESQSDLMKQLDAVHSSTTSAKEVAILAEEGYQAIQEQLSELEEVRDEATRRQRETEKLVDETKTVVQALRSSHSDVLNSFKSSDKSCQYLKNYIQRISYLVAGGAVLFLSVGLRAVC